MESNNRKTPAFYICSTAMCVLLIIIFIACNIRTAFAEDARDGEGVFLADNDTEFSMEVSKIITDNHEETEDLKESVRRRLLAVCSEQPDFSDLNGLIDVVSDGGALYVIQFESAQNAETAYQALSADARVQSIEFDSVVGSTALANGVKASGASHLSWGANVIGVDTYAEKTKNLRNKTLTVAVVDSGVQENHKFLSSRLVKGYDFVDNDATPNDLRGHGTHVAGIIVDCTTGEDKINVMPVRVLDKDGYGTIANVAAGVKYAAANGATVINISIEGGHSLYLDAAINEKIDQGVKVICAAGNDGYYIGRMMACPAHMKKVITVGAINNRLLVEDYSNFGDSLDVVAPGTDIYSSYISSKYALNTGTSMAAPHVTACVALLEQRYGKLSATQAESLVKRSCDPRSNKTRYGSGIVNLKNLIANIGGHNVKLNKSSVTYTGKALKPGFTVRRNNEVLFSNNDYTASYKNNVKVGRAKIVIAGKGTYYGSKVVYFNIVPKGTSIKKLNSGRKSIALKWKKQAKQTSGYQIQYAKNKKFKSAKIKTIKGKKKTGAVIKKLKARKKYYVRIRTYKKVSGKKYYSNWSKTKTIRTK